MGDRLIESRTLAVEAGETVVDLPVTEDWGAGAYVTATLIRPMDVAAGRNPARAIGLAWAPVDPGPRRLAVAFEGAGRGRAARRDRGGPEDRRPGARANAPTPPSPRSMSAS